jgi:hypothetical protein
MWTVWDTTQAVIGALECFVKCTDKLYDAIEQYFILPFYIFLHHYRILLLSFSFSASWRILEYRHVLYLDLCKSLPIYRFSNTPKIFWSFDTGVSEVISVSSWVTVKWVVLGVGVRVRKEGTVFSFLHQLDFGIDLNSISQSCFQVACKKKCFR